MYVVTCKKSYIKKLILLFIVTFNYIFITSILLNINLKSYLFIFFTFFYNYYIDNLLYFQVALLVIQCSYIWFLAW